MRFSTALILVTIGLFSHRVSAEPLGLHQFGTFSFLQERDGRAVGALNVDDEPAPPFVFRLGDGGVRRLNERPARWLQKYVECNPAVTARLEGPYTYFYPATGAAAVEQPEFSLSLELKGGELTEFFPAAEAAEQRANELTPNTVGKLSWSKLTLNEQEPMQATQDVSWLALRRPKSASVSTAVLGTAVSERYLFTSGIGHINAPLKVEERSGGALLSVTSTVGESLIGKRLWLVGVDSDGALAFNSVVGDKNSDREIALRGQFLTSDYRSNNLPKVKREIELELIASGLSTDEAAAMLDAWEFSYFKSPGQRLFFVAPQKWIESVLQMTVSLPVTSTRVFIGRIELIEPSQRAMIGKLAAERLNLSNMTAAYYDLFRRAPSEAATFANSPLSTLPEGFQIAVPKIYWSYLSMGRFRDALILDEYSRTGNANLKAFLSEVACKHVLKAEEDKTAVAAPPDQAQPEAIQPKSE